jgi:hypothetical protein
VVAKRPVPNISRVDNCAASALTRYFIISKLNIMVEGMKVKALTRKRFDLRKKVQKRGPQRWIVGHWRKIPEIDDYL